MNSTKGAIRDFLNDLQNQVMGEVWTDQYHRLLYSTDASLYQVMPYGVFVPKNKDDVQTAITLAAQYKVPVVPRGGGSSLAGQAVNEALIIDMSRHLDQIAVVNPEERWVRVQAGVVFDELNHFLRPHGLQFGPDPASGNRAVIGGIVGNNSTGSHSILYGLTVDHVLETEVILSDGQRAYFGAVEEAQLAQKAQSEGREGKIYRSIQEMVQTKSEIIQAGTPHHWRRCGGYNLDRFVEGMTYSSHQKTYSPEAQFNLAKLICGSEGTLGVITEVKLGLVPRPTQTALAIIQFDDLYEALEAVPVILETSPSAVELLDNLGLTMAREVPQYARMAATFMEGNPYCVLITEFYGNDEIELKAKIEQLQQRLRRAKIGYTGITPAFETWRQNNVWSVRKAGLGLLMSIKSDCKPIPFIEDTAVPVEKLAEYIRRLETFCREEMQVDIIYYAHASAGCLHIRPLIDTKQADEVNKLLRISNFVRDLVAEYGGAFSSEHGDGRARSWQNEIFFGKPLYDLYREVKYCFDPDNIFNPGNIVDGPPMTQNLRYGGDYHTIPLQEHIDFSADHGFARAVEMCNGAGVCRKRTTGAMCPSFMVTREEEHSTRGRANALRAALSGLLPPSELTSQRMYEVMELCIQCKACKSECPSSVDMAKLKLEFLAQYHEKHGIPLQSKLFAEIAFWSHLASGSTASLVNKFAQNPLLRWGLEKFGGVSRQRALPHFAPMPFTRWFKYHHHKNGDKNKAKQVVLFNDTFNTYNDPHIAIAATELLEAAGFEVILPGHHCCGRPAISKGLISKARRMAKETITRLYPLAQQGLPIVGLEPSCLLSMRDEYFALFPYDSRVELIAKHCFTIEEFLSQLADKDQLPLEFEEESRHILLHGHCHQKSLVGTEPSKRMLSLPKNYQVTEVDSSCCGMAGSFGYEVEHYDISMQMAQRRLIPAVMDQKYDIVVAAGTSCRQQIEDSSGKQVLHPVEVLQKAMRPRLEKRR